MRKIYRQEGQLGCDGKRELMDGGGHTFQAVILADRRGVGPGVATAVQETSCVCDDGTRPCAMQLVGRSRL